MKTTAIAFTGRGRVDNPDEYGQLFIVDGQDKTRTVKAFANKGSNKQFKKLCDATNFHKGNWDMEVIDSTGIRYLVWNCRKP